MENSNVTIGKELFNPTEFWGVESKRNPAIELMHEWNVSCARLADMLEAIMYREDQRENVKLTHYGEQAMRHLQDAYASVRQAINVQL